MPHGRADVGLRKEHRTEEALKTLGLGNRKYAGDKSGFAPKITASVARDTTNRFPNGMPKAAAPGEFRPDMDKYVKRMSIIDEHGCSSGQQWNAVEQVCKFGPILRMPTITPEELDYFFNIGRPVILTNFTPEWKANENWTPERLKEKYGHLTVNVQKGRSKNKNFETEQHLLRLVLMEQHVFWDRRTRRISQLGGVVVSPFAASACLSPWSLS
eukprot:1182667-Prorocentrum_minimum.AAC.5